MLGDLNRRFGIETELEFRAGEGGLPRAVIANSLSTAEVYLHGAHVTAYRRRDGQPVLWMSELAQFRAGTAIRGGIPVAWPWFGPHPLDPALPQHGFARTSDWTVIGTQSLSDGATQIGLCLEDDGETRGVWPHRFRLELLVTVGQRLSVRLLARNTGQDTIDVGGALHTYFQVGDIERVRIAGLDGRRYLDQLDGHRVKNTSGELSISSEVDRVYVDTEDRCVIEDLGMGRKLTVDKAGSRTTVVWNPWAEKSLRMADFPDHGYRSMVCIEAANAKNDTQVLPPGAVHELSQTITEASDRNRFQRPRGGPQ